MVILFRIGAEWTRTRTNTVGNKYRVHRSSFIDANRIFNQSAQNGATSALCTRTHTHTYAHVPHPIGISLAISTAKRKVYRAHAPRTIGGRVQHFKIYSKTIRNSFVNWPESMKIVWRSRARSVRSVGWPVVSLSPLLQLATLLRAFLMNSLRVSFFAFLHFHHWPFCAARTAHSNTFYHFSSESLSLKPFHANEERTL